jgi:acyl carrier protein
MTRQDVLRLLEETLEMPPHALTGTEALRDLGGWDSLSTLAFVAAVDSKFGTPLPGKRVAQCRTVADLLGLVSEVAASRAA